MKNGKGNHIKGSNGSVPIPVIKTWFDKTEKILWAIEKGQEESRAETKKLIAKQDQRIEASEKRIEQNEKAIAELKESNKEQREANKEQRYLNSIFGREILKSHGYTNEQIDKMLPPQKS